MERVKSKAGKNLRRFGELELVGLCNWLNREKEGVGPWLVVCVIRLNHLAM